MKITSVALLVIVLLYFTSIFASNIMLKIEFNKIDRSDIYWNYKKIEQEEFRHLIINGGNLFNIAFEPAAKSSVRVLDYAEEGMRNRISASVKNDTLYLNIDNTYRDLGERDWMRHKTLVRLFAPQLLSVTCTNTNLGLYKMKQKNLLVNLAGRSVFEMESFLPQMDAITINQRDTSFALFELAPELGLPGTMQLKSLRASVQGNSRLNAGQFSIESPHFTIADSAAISFSGNVLKQLHF